MALNINGTTGISGVDGSVSAPALTGTDSNTGITFPAADTIKFSTGGVERMAITNSGVSGITTGITMADQWRVTTNFDTANANMITSNWERNDTDFALIGSGMSESSGLFTFPETGIYKIEFSTKVTSSNQQVRYIVNEIILSNNNFSSSHSGAFSSQSLSNDASADATGNCSCIFDVTNTSTHKVKFTVYSEHVVTWSGSSISNATYATFIRLGDT